MKNPVNIAKKSYNRILKIDDIAWQLQQINEKQIILEKKIDKITELLTQLDNNSHDSYNKINDAIQNNIAINTLRFNALYGKPDESPTDTNKRFFEKLPLADGDLRIFQKGNAKLLKQFIKICEEHKLTYFLQSGTLLGAVRHQGFVPWDDDTDVAMFRDDIDKLKTILKNDTNYKLTIVYDFFVLSRQIRFKTRNENNPCFLDIYIYDYGSSATEKDWQIWRKDKNNIIKTLWENHRSIMKEWEKTPLADSNSKLGKKLTPIFKKYYDPLIPKNVDKHNYEAVCWGLDNFPVKWNRLFEKEFIFPTVKLKFEGINVQAPHKYLEYLKRQYGNIYQLPNDLATHYKHIDQTNINIEIIKKFLNN
jgi:lipopolysaccharide cholinephosphotransferase